MTDNMTSFLLIPTDVAFAVLTFAVFCCAHAGPGLSATQAVWWPTACTRERSRTGRPHGFRTKTGHGTTQGKKTGNQSDKFSFS